MFDDPFVKDTLTPWLSVIGCVGGVIGTILGVWNLWLTRRSHKLKVRVIAQRHGENWIEVKNCVEIGHPELRELTIRVINDSYFAITVVEVGLVLKPSFLSRRLFMRLHIGGWKEKQEKRVEPRHFEDFSIWISNNSYLHKSSAYPLLVHTSSPSIYDAVALYATLATGQRFIGGRKKVKPIVTEMKACLDSLASRFPPTKQ